jgi:hypothetical protein
VPLDSKGTKAEHYSHRFQPSGIQLSGDNVMPELSENSRYEQACDQAIAMCDGNLRSTIKALIMANEYLEIELEELQAAVADGCAPAQPSRASSSAA